MTSSRMHGAALVFFAIAAAAAALGGEPTGPDWVRLVGLAMVPPALLLCICTTPRSRR